MREIQYPPGAIVSLDANGLTTISYNRPSNNRPPMGNAYSQPIRDATIARERSEGIPPECSALVPGSWQRRQQRSSFLRNERLVAMRERCAESETASRQCQNSTAGLQQDVSPQLHATSSPPGHNDDSPALSEASDNSPVTSDYSDGSPASSGAFDPETADELSGVFESRPWFKTRWDPSRHPTVFRGRDELVATVKGWGILHDTPFQAVKNRRDGGGRFITFCCAHGWKPGQEWRARRGPWRKEDYCGWFLKFEVEYEDAQDVICELVSQNELHMGHDDKISDEAYFMEMCHAYPALEPQKYWRDELPAEAFRRLAHRYPDDPKVTSSTASEVGKLRERKRKENLAEGRDDTLAQSDDPVGARSAKRPRSSTGGFNPGDPAQQTPTSVPNSPQYAGIPQPAQRPMPALSGAPLNLAYAQGQQYLQFSQMGQFQHPQLACPSPLLNITNRNVHVYLTGDVHVYTINNGDVHVYVGSLPNQMPAHAPH